MEETKNFEEFYLNKLTPLLETLCLESNNALKWKTGGIIAFIISIFCFIDNQILVGIILIIVVIVCIYKFTTLADKFVGNYKSTIINEIIRYLNPEIQYYPSKNISSKDYKKSGLFRHYYDYYDGDDLMIGVYKNVTFYCSELETQYYRTGVSVGRQVLIFRGLFFCSTSRCF